MGITKLASNPSGLAPHDMAVPLDDVALEVVQQGDAVHVPVEVCPLAAQRVRAPLGDQEHVVDALLGLVTGDGMDTWDC